MARSDPEQILTGEILDETSEITILQLCRSCSVQAETIEAMVEHGVLEPTRRRGHYWCFSPGSIKRTRVALHLQRDLGVNLAGAALALDLLERIDELNARVQAARYRETEHP